MVGAPLSPDRGDRLLVRSVSGALAFLGSAEFAVGVIWLVWGVHMVSTVYLARPGAPDADPWGEVAVAYGFLMALSGSVALVSGVLTWWGRRDRVGRAALIGLVGAVAALAPGTFYPVWLPTF